jgi:hypothetical protein
MLNAVFRRHAAHGFGHFPGFWAVIYFRQDVAVNVNHAARLEQIRKKDSKF